MENTEKVISLEESREEREKGEKIVYNLQCLERVVKASLLNLVCENDLVGLDVPEVKRGCLDSLDSIEREIKYYKALIRER